MPPTEGAEEVLRDHYPGLAPHLLAPFFDVVTFARELCSGDLEKFLILLSAALRAFSDRGRRLPAPGKTACSPQPFDLSRGTNIRSISDSLVIPRETVRRKVAELEAAGLLERREREIFCTLHTIELLQGVWNRLAKLAERNYRTVSQLQDRG